MWHYHYLSTVKGYVAQVGLKVFISTECAISRYNQWASRELLLHQFSGARWLIVGSFNRAASLFQPRPISQRYTWHRLVTANERLQRQRRHPREWAQRRFTDTGAYRGTFLKVPEKNQSIRVRRFNYSATSNNMKLLRLVQRRGDWAGLVGIDHFVECPEDRPVIVWEMLINVLKFHISAMLMDVEKWSGIRITANS